MIALHDGRNPLGFMYGHKQKVTTGFTEAQAKALQRKQDMGNANIAANWYESIGHPMKYGRSHKQVVHIYIGIQWTTCKSANHCGNRLSKSE